MMEIYILLTIICQNAITATQYIPTNSVIFDLTRPVNELIDKKISRDEFLSDVHSAVGLIGANVTTSTIFYATAGGFIEELEEQTIAACKIINEMIERTKASQLLIYWKLNSTTLKNLQGHEEEDSNYNNTFDGCKPFIILNLYNETGCEEVESLLHFLWSSKNEIFAASGLDETSIECGHHAFSSSLKLSVVNIKFGPTIGVTESFGLFETRMKFLSERLLHLEFARDNQELVYFPTPEFVGKDNHQRMLIRYAYFWTISDKTRGSIVVPVPKSKNEVSTTQFSVVPGIYYYSQYERQLEIPWSSILLSTVFKQNQTVVISGYVYDSWNIRLKHTVSTENVSSVATPIDILLDYSKKKCGTYGYHPTDISYYPTLLSGGIPSTIIVSVTKGEDTLESKEKKENQEDNEEESCTTDYVQLVKQLSSKSTVGCKFATKTFQTITEFNATNVVNACQRYNGSFYILGTTVKLEWFKEIGQYSFYFENTVRKELHAINRFRKQIFEMEPSVKVYFTFDIEEIGRPSLQKSLLYSQTLLCQDLEPTVNLYYEGIFNWAKLESFPIIVRIDFKYLFDYFGGWVSLMRRLNYPYSDWSVEGITGNQSQSSTTSPSFLMQEYIKPIHSWEMDACIDWTEKRWEIADNFFHTTKIGATFYPEGIFNNRTNAVDQNTTEDAYSTMLNFVFYRFRLVELSISSNFRNLLSAMGHTEYKYMNAQILINYDIPEMNSHSDLSEFESFLFELKKQQVYKKGLLRGLHTKILVDAKMYETDEFKFNNFETVSALIKLARLSNIGFGIELPSLQTCNQMLQHFIIYRNSISADLINTLGYVICKEKSEHFSSAKSKPEWESVLDSHLMLKRVVHEFVPHLQVYFRVEVDVEIGQNTVTLDEYTNLLALFKTFGTAYNISYFVVDAFDTQLKSKKNGWWGIANYSDLANPKSYVEKGTVLRGQRMWYPPPPSPSSSTVTDTQASKLVIIGVSVGSGVVIILLALVVFFGCHYMKLRHFGRFLSDLEVQEFLNGRVAANSEPNNMEMELMGAVELEHMKFNQEYKLTMPEVTIDFAKILGSGAFGTVYKGLTKDIPAAIKRPNADCSKNTFKNVLGEVKVLSYIGSHTNVVGFLGAYVDEIHKGVLYISTELCSGGSLEAFLRTKSNVISQAASDQNAKRELEASELYIHELNTFAMEIAQGMEYIESRRVVHGDLATRNVLLDDNLVCKIGDFGLSRKLYEYQKYVKTSQEPLPWKWMAPESLSKMEFTSKSDVWSFGVTIWEIYSLGKIPYAGLNWSVDFAKDLQNGLRLTIPDFALENIFSKMLDCWKLNPAERPTFADFVNFYKNLDEAVYTVLDLNE